MGSMLEMPSYSPAKRQVVTQIMKWMRDGSLGEGAPIPPETMLAQCLKVSRGSIRAGLDALERDGVIVKRRQRRYLAVQGKRKDGGLLSDTVLLFGVTSENPMKFIGSGFQDALPAGAAEEAISLGLHTMSLHPEKADFEFVTSLLAHSPYGALLFQPFAQTSLGARVLKEFKGNGVRYVLGFEPDAATPPSDSVFCDHRNGMRMLASRLVETGFKRILCIQWQNGMPWSLRKEEGYKECVMKAGLEPMMLRLPAEPFEFKSGSSREMSFDKYVHLMAGYMLESLDGCQPPDMVLAPSDWDVPIVAGALRLFSGRRGWAGIPPIAGYDNKLGSSPWLAFDNTSPVLTIDRRNTEAGRLMMRLLMRRASGCLGAEPVTELVEPELLELAPVKGKGAKP